MLGAACTIRGGTVVTHDGRVSADIAIRDGVVTAIEPGLQRAGRDIDATGLLVLPGAVDIHTHLATEAAPGVSSADDWYSGTVAAACGGVTTVIDYVRQREHESLPAMMARWRALAGPAALIDHGFHAVPTDFGPAVLAQIPELVAAGYPGVKIFMSRVSDDDMARAMSVLASCGGVAMVHSEDQAMRDRAYARLRAEGRATARAWPEARPREGELAAAERAVEHCARTGCPTYLVHLSTRESVDAARAGKSRGLSLFAETRPCYLLLTQDRYEDPFPGYLQFTGYPPLRTRDDVEAVWAGVVDGTIDAIGSDHLSWTIEQKAAGDRDLDALLVGLPALETEVRALFSAGVSAGRITAERFVEIMAATPARVAGLFPRKGTLAAGSDADVVIVDPSRRETIRGSAMHGGAGHEPLDGLACVGWPVLTLSRGEVVAEDGRPRGTAGRGIHLRRPPFDRHGASARAAAPQASSSSGYHRPR
jgi:dihydropyrimidinase